MLLPSKTYDFLFKTYIYICIYEKYDIFFVELHKIQI